MQTYIYVIAAILVVLTIILGVGFLLQSQGAYLFKAKKESMNDEEKSLSSSEESKKEIKSKYNVYSIVGMVLSCVSIFGVGLLGYIGIVLGIVAITQIKHTHEKGFGLAWAAIVIGAIGGPFMSLYHLGIFE